MSQQLSMLPTSGLLSISTTLPPQSAGGAGSAGVPPFAGFGSIIGNITSENQSPQSFGGLTLPPQGTTLPQEIVDKLDLNAEQIKQRLLNIADMLNQQADSETGSENLSSNVMSELAKALKFYAQDNNSDLPDELKQKLAEQRELIADSIDAVAEKVGTSVDELVEAVTESADGPIHGLAKVLQPEAEELSGAEQPQSQGETTDSVDELDLPSQELVDGLANGGNDQLLSSEDGVQGGEVAVPVAEQESPLSTQEERVEHTEALIALDGEADPATEESVDESNEEVLASVAENVVEEPVEEDVPQTVGISSLGVAVEGRRSAVAEAARQSVVPDESKNKGEYISSIARQANQARGGQSGAIESNVDDSDQTLKAPQTNLPNRPSDKAESKAAGAELLQRNVAAGPEASQPVKVSQEPVQKQQGGPVSLDKFESMLEFSQKLMSKAAAGGEKLGESPFSQRSESGLLAGAVPQNVSQPTQVQKAVSEANNLMMPQNVKINTPAWSNALAERAVMIAAQNTRVAEIQLDPPELGSLNIRIQVNQDQVSLNITSPHAHVRDAVEQSLPRLREMFAEQGLALQDSSVSDQQQGNEKREEFAGDGEPGYSETGMDDSFVEGEQRPGRGINLVDYYA